MTLDDIKNEHKLKEDIRIYNIITTKLREALGRLDDHLSRRDSKAAEIVREDMALINELSEIWLEHYKNATKNND